ncbi:MAG: hypothetical protein HOO88_05775 [Kiritimatiellaceae bacterium]|nr:hypothetical protein [Kiritimatiellaceae bacterium]
MKWINFLRKYGPIPRNDNMFDETIQRSAQRNKIDPILFEHPFQQRVFECFKREQLRSIILTGTAGDGKTHLCREVWNSLGGDAALWASDDPYLLLPVSRSLNLHFIRDLSGWAPPQGTSWSDVPHKKKLMGVFCESLFAKKPSDVFMIAGNDGQLIEALRRLDSSDVVVKARDAIEELLVEDLQLLKGVELDFFNLSRGSSAELFDRAVKAFLDHPGWKECYALNAGPDEFFGNQCPVRRNYELLQQPLMQQRIHLLFELCDYNNLHLPIRQILLLLTNAVLGHPSAHENLMRAIDVPKIIASGEISKGAIYNNIFGGNLSERSRSSITIFNYFNRLQIGYETNNRIDNILIYGEYDEFVKREYDSLIGSDSFYGADASYQMARKQYVEAGDEDEDSANAFLEMLVRQRRGIFFKIPREQEKEFKFWELTVFKHAGEYVSDVCELLMSGGGVDRRILGRLIKGLNRVFTGMLVDDERRLYLATSGSHSQAKISRVYLGHISVQPSKGERISIALNDQTKRIDLQVYFSLHDFISLELNLVRFEFLSRVASEGALPTSFSKECYEDIQAFKSRLIAKANDLQSSEVSIGDNCVELQILNSDNGKLEHKTITIKR